MTNEQLQAENERLRNEHLVVVQEDIKALNLGAGALEVANRENERLRATVEVVQEKHAQMVLEARHRRGQAEYFAGILGGSISDPYAAWELHLENNPAEMKRWRPNAHARA